MRLTPVQKQERADFVLNRLKRGFSFLETQRQFAKTFDCCMETARKWANWACDQVAEQEDQSTRKRHYNVVVEMFHDQIVSYQNELIAMQREIDSVSGILDRRNGLIAELDSAIGQRKKEIVAELGVLPQVSLTAKAGLIEAKTRIRERLYRVMNDLARLRGISGAQGDWRSALNTLMDNNLLPPAVANLILQAIDDFEGNVRSMGTEQQPEGEQSTDIPDLDLLEPAIPDMG